MSRSVRNRRDSEAPLPNQGVNVKGFFSVGSKWAQSALFQAKIATIGTASELGKAALHAKDTLKEGAEIFGVREAAGHLTQVATLAAKIPLGTLNAVWHTGVTVSGAAVGKVTDFARYFEEELEEAGTEDTREYDILLSAVGATEIQIPARSRHEVNIHVPAGSAVVWKARVRTQDIIFELSETYDEKEPVVRVEPIKCPCTKPIKGTLKPQKENRTLVLAFDNSHSQLQKKTVAYWILTGPDASLTEEAGDAAKVKEIAAAEDGPAE